MQSWPGQNGQPGEGGGEGQEEYYDDEEDLGLQVTITPSQSAFFAGELFQATITFKNPAPPPLPPPSSHSHPHPPSASNHHQPLSTPRSSSWKQPLPLAQPRSRPPSASHLGLAEYASSHLDSDEVPPSPFMGTSADAFTGEWKSSPPLPPSTPLPLPPTRESTISTTSGGALPTPMSASFNHNNNQPYRSLSGSTTPIPTSKPSNLPQRKGLIGKPLLTKSAVNGGIYAGGPRRPGDNIRGHGRAMSMISSSPDLLERSAFSSSGSGKAHGRSRLGGSVGGEMLMSQAMIAHDKKHSSSSIGGRATTSIAEEPLSPLQTLSPQTSSPPSSIFNHPYSNPSRYQPTNSTFSLPQNEEEEEGSDYDPSDSTSALPNQGFYGVGQIENMESRVREGLEDWTRKSTLPGSKSMGGYGYNHGGDEKRSVSDKHPYNSLASSTSSTLYSSHNSFLYPPHTLTVLWSFAHLEGTFEVEDLLIKPSEFIEVKRGLTGVTSGYGVGGGTLDEPSEGRGWRDWIWNGGGGKEKKEATLAGRKISTMREKSIPTFSSPPSILGVDLVLEPGQSKSYSFSIRVPADLPPSFRGKAIKFSYHLVVGTNRSQLGPMSPLVGSTKDSVSRIMRVPVRMYNHVGITGARPFYDLTNPIVYHRDEAKTSGIDEILPTKRARRMSDGSGRLEFETYAAALIDSLSLPATRRPSADLLSPRLSNASIQMEAPPSLRPEMGPRSGSLMLTKGEHGIGLGQEEEQGVNCKSAVEIVSRNSQKVSYDINKDGYMVASLTLVKSSYRLGETVNGSVVINSGEGRVLRISARLETHELIETSISKKPAPQVRQITRRLHSEHHETTLDSARVGFALAIPSGATPDFATSGVKLQWSVRLSFLVIPPSPDAPVGGKPGTPTRSGRSGAPPPQPPPSTPSSSSSAIRHGRSKSFAYGFEPAVPLTLPAAPLVQPTGAAHLMPVYGRQDSNASYTTYRAVPDLGYVPVLYCSTPPEAPPSPGPLQRSAQGASHKASPSLSIRPPGLSQSQASVVLVPAKVETVECSIPIKVYPGNTPFRPTLSIFSDIE